MQKGFERVSANLADIKLDYPSGPQEFETCKAAAERSGWLKQEVLM